jgi:hypothetical protein
MPTENGDTTSPTAMSVPVTPVQVTSNNPPAPPPAANAASASYPSLTGVPPAPPVPSKDTIKTNFDTMNAQQKTAEANRGALMNDTSATVMTSPQTGQLVQNPADAVATHNQPAPAPVATASASVSPVSPPPAVQNAVRQEPAENPHYEPITPAPPPAPVAPAPANAAPKPLMSESVPPPPVNGALPPISALSPPANNAPAGTTINSSSLPDISRLGKQSDGAPVVNLVQPSDSAGNDYIEGSRYATH